MSDPDTRRPVVVVVGALAPYTHDLYQRVAEGLDRPLHVLACSARESSRHWELPAQRRYRFDVLPGFRWHRSSVTNVYANPSVIPRLAALRPAAVVLNDFSPTMVMAAGAARWLGSPYALRTDGVPETDPGRRSGAHRWMRRSLVPHAAFGIGPSRGSAALLEAYGLRPERFVLAPLHPAWRPLQEPAPSGRPYDVLFCGSLNEAVKGARFFTDVVLGCAGRGRRLRVRVAGDGPLRDEMRARFAEAGIEARFDGFVQQAGLAEVYASATLFHFPSRGDVWGIVVQEALQSGTTVLASPHSGAARELLAEGGAGIVLPLEIEAWVAETLAVLDDPGRRDALRAGAAATIIRFSPERATDAYLSVIAALTRRGL